jgi:platelet-activating factor acetylhydrolase
MLTRIGPYTVGTCDCELPVYDLDAPSEAPSANPPETVSFRIFYPCTPQSRQRAVRWVPSPQRGYLSAYARFVGANSAISEAFS